MLFITPRHLTIVLCIIFYLLHERFLIIGGFTLKTLNDLDSKDNHYKIENVANDVKTNLLISCDKCPNNVDCVQPIQCPAHVRMGYHEKPQICDLDEGSYGFCCLSGQNHTYKKNVENIARVVQMERSLPLETAEEARLTVANLVQQISNMPILRGEPNFLHELTFHSTPTEDFESNTIANSALEQIIASQIFSKKEQIPLDDIITNNININFMETPLAHHCHHKRVFCNNLEKYRTIDGTCNNLLPYRSHWGSAGEPMERLLPPSYEDGIWSPRIHSVDGSLLMGAREISRRLFKDINKPHQKHNLLLMQFGQFIAHDVSQSSSIRLPGGKLIHCCDGVSHLSSDKLHFACFPISVAPDDEFYSAFNVKCLNFVRLALAPSSDCKIHYGKQRSKVTHFLDGSTIYGSNMNSLSDLRTFQGGKLKMLHDFGRDLLPLTNDMEACDSDNPGKSCFKSGDGRTNQIISLIIVHTIFAREHNRIAEELRSINPQLSDEMLFHEARRIVIAEIQHITYNEYLPSVIGPVQMRRFRLNPKHHGFNTDSYNVDTNPAITNEFSGAAFRMGHSSVDGRFHIYNDRKNIDEIIHIPDTMFNPSRLRKREFYDNLILSLIDQPMQNVDSSITFGLSRFMFRGHTPFGLDLVALNIQRGRDQGLRSYNDYLELMGHNKITNFNQLPAEIGQKLAEVYNSPDDIELWVGGLQEKPVNGGIVGATFSEIIADQFARFKKGDRYFYEYSTPTNPGAFTLNQLHEIRKISMSRLICDNSDNIKQLKIPPAAFVRSDFPGNEPVPCSNIPRIDLEAWRA